MAINPEPIAASANTNSNILFVDAALAKVLLIIHPLSYPAYKSRLAKGNSKSTFAFATRYFLIQSSIMDLNNKVVAITGGGSGIGRALALTFAKEGARVACLGRRLERLHETVREIENNGGSGLAVAVNITDEHQVRQAVAEITEKLGAIDVLFNNAGSFASLGAVFEVDRTLWWQDVTVNLKGVMLMMREILPQMMKQDSGVIINMNGGRPVGGSGYAAGKAGMMELTRVASLELQQLNSNVIILGAGPGLVQTEMTQMQADSEAGQRWIPSTKESIDAGTTRSPFDIAHKTIEVLKATKPEWNGKYFGPETDLAEW